jgi:hypothetical protein
MLTRPIANAPGHLAVVPTAFGPVEVMRCAGTVQSSSSSLAATVPPPRRGADLYTELGCDLVVFSRPGYGRTDVGPLSAAEFVPAIRDCCRALGMTSAAAVVGVSFGGLQALPVATTTDLAARLVLHSCAPSTRPFPDTRRHRLGAPLVFGPATGRATWAAVRALVASERGLRTMMGTLTRLPVETWWATWTDADQAAARRTFRAMDAHHGITARWRRGLRPRRGPSPHDPARGAGGDRRAQPLLLAWPATPSRARSGRALPRGKFILKGFSSTRAEAELSSSEKAHTRDTDNSSNAM